MATTSPPPSDNEPSAKKVKLEDDTELIKKEPATDHFLNLRDQIDYYFGDYNLHFDTYLNEQLEKGGGWMPVAELLKFKRVSEVTNILDKIVATIEKSQLVELSECKTKIRRSKLVPLPDKETYLKGVKDRTLHLKGFPLTVEREELQRFCAQFGGIDSLQMRKYFKTRQFKGCIHVVFKSADVAKKILESTPLKYKDRELMMEDMEAYHKRKEQMRKQYLEKKGQDQKKRGKKNGNKQQVDQSEPKEKQPEIDKEAEVVKKEQEAEVDEKDKEAKIVNKEQGDEVVEEDKEAEVVKKEQEAELVEKDKKAEILKKEQEASADAAVTAL